MAKKKKFKWLQALKKGARAAAAIGVALGAGSEVLADASDGGKITVVVGASAAAMAIRVFLNAWSLSRENNKKIQLP